MVEIPNCAKCPGKFCRGRIKSEDILPDFCPIKSCKEIIEEVKGRYREEGVEKLYRTATLVERDAYERVRGTLMAVRPRIREIAEFSKLMGLSLIHI